MNSSFGLTFVRYEKAAVKGSLAYFINAFTVGRILMVL